MRYCKKCAVKNLHKEDYFFCENRINVINKKENKFKKLFCSRGWLGILIFVFLIGINGCGEGDYYTQSVEIDNNIFSFSTYTLFEEDRKGDYNFVLVPVTIQNNNSKKCVISYDNFTIDSKDLKPLTNYDVFFNDQIEISSNDHKELELIFKVPKSINLSDESIEVDLSIFKIGENISFNKLKKINSNVSFEKYVLQKKNINEKDINVLTDIIKKEALGAFYTLTYTFDETINEKIYLFDCKRGNYCITIGKDNLVNMFDVESNSMFPVYIDNEKNQFYVYKDIMAAKYESLKTTVKLFLDDYFYNARTSDFSWTRLLDAENAMVISCVVQGQNTFGQTLTRNFSAYYDYNKEKLDFELFATKIGNEVEDDRYTIKFETGCNISISNQKVSKNYYVKEPAVKLYNEGYKFIGWKNKANNARYSFNSSPNSDLTLVAIWERVLDN